MAELRYFTARLYWYDIVGDSPEEISGDVDENPDTKGINGAVTITPSVRGLDLRALKAPTLSPNPAVFALAPIEARIDDGRLKLTAAQADVKLTANCPVLELPDDATLVYEFKPHHVVFNGKQQTLPTITIVAPEIADASTVVVDLATVEWVENGATSGGITYIRHVPDDVQLTVDGDIQFYAGGDALGDPLDVVVTGVPADMDDITDATTVGKAVARAVDQAAARTAIGAADTAALALKAPLASPSFTGTPTGITKTHVGLGNVDNTSDTAKPVSTAQQTALDAKAPIASPTFTGTVAGITKAMVGLGSVDNVADASKPVSTAQAAAIAAAQSAAIAASQPSDADLAAIAALASAANKLPYATGAGTWTLADFTSAARALLDDPDTAAMRATLGLGSVVPVYTTGLTYYVSPTGSDANNGRTTGAAFATPAAALAVAPAGSTILLKRGGTWTAEVNPTAHGITLGAYGSGAMPVIDRGTEPTGGLFNDGFESESSAFTTNWNGKTEASSSTVTLETTNPLRGTKSLKYTHASGGSAYVTKTFTGQAQVYVQFKVKIKKLVTGSAYGGMKILELLGGWGSIYLQHDATPKRGLQIRLVGGTPTQDLQGTTYYQEGQTLRIELHYRNSAGANATEVWVNGSRVFTIATSDTATDTGFRLGGCAVDGTFGVATELLFDDVKVSTTAVGIGTRGSQALTVEGDDFKLQDVEVRNTDQYWIKLRNCRRATVRRNFLHDCTRVGLIASIGGGDHIIEDNEMCFTGGDAAAYGEGNAVQFLDTITGTSIVRRNEIHHIGDEAGDHGIYSEGGLNLFTDNRFYGVSGYAVKCLGGSAGSTVFDNRYEFCRTGEVLIDSTSPMTMPVNVYHNSGYMCGVYPDGLSPYVAIWITGYGSARLFNNISSGSGIGIEVDANADLVESDTNDIYTGVRFGYWKGAGDQAALSDWRTASGLDGGTIAVDPLFTDPDAGDLTLQSGSPAKNIGTIIAGINDGYLGAAPDLGYIEVG